MVRVPMTYVTTLPDEASIPRPEPAYSAVINRRLSIETSRKRKRTDTSSARTSKVMKIATFPFLRLPLELRLKVFEDYFQLEHAIPRCDIDCPNVCHYHKRGYTCILYVSKQVYAEVWPIYTRYQCFTFRQFMILTEDFLRVLSTPQLHRIKHLAIHNGLDYGHRRFIGGLLKTWWKYLDVFSRLETLTFEAVTHGAWKPHHIPNFYKLIPVLIQLLEQGASHRSVCAGNGRNGSANMQTSLDLPESHLWALHIGGIGLRGRDGCRVSEVIAYHKIIVQRHTADFSHPPDLRRGRINQMERELVAQNSTRETFSSYCVSYCYLNVIDNANREYGISAVSRDVCQQFARFKLGFGSHLLNDMIRPSTLPGYHSADIVTIVGQWNNGSE